MRGSNYFGNNVDYQQSQYTGEIRNNVGRNDSITNLITSQENVRQLTSVTAAKAQSSDPKITVEYVHNILKTTIGQVLNAANLHMRISGTIGSNEDLKIQMINDMIVDYTVRQILSQKYLNERQMREIDINKVAGSNKPAYGCLRDGIFSPPPFFPHLAHKDGRRHTKTGYNETNNSHTNHLFAINRAPPMNSFPSYSYDNEFVPSPCFDRPLSCGQQEFLSSYNNMVAPCSSSSFSCTSSNKKQKLTKKAFSERQNKRNRFLPPLFFG